MNGNVVYPSSKVIEFTKDTNKNKMETILTADQAAEFAIEKVFPNWDPRSLAAQVSAPAASYDTKVITWAPVEDAVAYALFNNGKFVAITTETSYALEGANENDNYTIRSANSMGGFGEAAGVVGLSSVDEIKADTAEVVGVTYYNLQGAVVDPSFKGVVLKVTTFANGRKQTTKIINR